MIITTENTRSVQYGAPTQSKIHTPLTSPQHPEALPWLVNVNYCTAGRPKPATLHSREPHYSQGCYC